MTRLRLSILPRFCSVALLLLAMLPGSTSAQVQGTTYTSVDYGFTVEWTDDWQVLDDFVESYGIGLSSDDSMIVYIEGYDGDFTPADLLEPLAGDTVVLDDRAGEPARAHYESDGGFHIYMESFSIDGGATTMLVSVLAQEDVLPDAVEYAREEITINGNAAVSGASLGGSEPTETPEPTVQASSPGTFTGPVYGYTVSYDPDIWTLAAEIHEGNVDGVQLTRDGTAFTIWAWDRYGNDARVCLEGEVAYYSQEMESVSDWEPALDANGQPLRYESDTLAWGVFDLTYTYESGNSAPLVDYISCEPIPGQDAVLVVLISSNPQIYDDEFELALDVLDTLEFADVPDTEITEPTAEPEIVDTTIEIDTNLSGSEYVSPNYGFTATIPLEWQIVDEAVEGTDERLVVSNGTSEVTLWATDAFSGSLAACVDFAAESSGLNLQIDRDATGEEFRGVYRNEAFANFVYEQDGTRMMYFVNCQAIPGTGGHLILIHDVEYDRFTSERRFRSEIENSIVMP